MKNNANYFKSSHVSYANSSQVLLADVQEFLIDIWHNKEAFLFKTKHPEMKTKLKIIFDLRLFNAKKTDENKHYLNELQKWLIANQVEFQIASVSKNIQDSAAHLLIVELVA